MVVDRLSFLFMGLVAKLPLFVMVMVVSMFIVHTRVVIVG